MFNYAIRFAYNLKYNDHVSPSILKFGPIPFAERRKIHIASIAYKILNSLAPNYLDHLISINKNNTRAANNMYKKTFMISIPKIWNGICDSIRNKKSLQSFNSSLKQSYIDKFETNINLSL